MYVNWTYVETCAFRAGASKPACGEERERMVRRTKEEALETRARILDAAEQVFYEKGVAHASLEDIAVAAEVTRGAIYWHFKDKAEVFDAMMQRVVLPVEHMLERADCCAQADPLQLLRTAMEDVLVRTARDARMQRVFDIAYHKCEYVGDAAGVRDRHVASQQQCMKSIEAGFRACIECGQLPAQLDARVAAIGALSLVSGLIANWVLDPKGFSLERHAATLVDIYFRGLVAAPAGAAPGTARKVPGKTDETKAPKDRSRARTTAGR
jgi:TetR/AcrR family acrAB operon transcriptional repressor